MKRFVRIIGIVGAVLLAAAASALAYLTWRKPDMRPPSSETITATPERIARGEYIARHVAGCLDCHSDAYVDRFSLPVKTGTLGQGGFAFDEKLGVPGVVQAQNITSDRETGVGGWTDGEILRAIREGVDKNGVALFPQMPYPSFRAMSDEDARSVVAYIRTLSPIQNTVAPRHLDFPVNLLIKGSPKPLAGPVAAPPRSDSVAYGGYLVTIAGCRECHTAHDSHGGKIAGLDFAGGWEMRGPWGRVVSANITPDSGTWLGRASREEFLGRFRAFASFEGDKAPVAPKGRNTVMPWVAFSGMSPEDLSAIYDYLKTISPIPNRVESFPDAPKEPGEKQATPPWNPAG
jgi:mono/diheme cytochrome c family protein